ncbi:MAG: hypothetical protein ACD_63C00247G0001 [uncultured bacterium]|nr:MAG: hypothetical protein ACD_63C00247G0001 [uncultured bacterium]
MDLKAWTKVIATTGKARQVFAEQLHQIFNDNIAQEEMLVDVMAGETARSENKTKHIRAENRQKAAVATVEGEEAAEKADLIHQKSGGSMTLDTIEDKETNFTTIDLKYMRGASDEGILDEPERREKLADAKSEGIRSTAEEHWGGYRFVSNGVEVSVNKNESIKQALDELVMGRLIEALQKTAEILSGKPIDASEEVSLSREESAPLIDIYKEDIRRRFKGGVESMTADHYRKAA